MRLRKATRSELDLATPRPLSPRAAAAARRDEQLRRALNLAATQPSSQVVIVEPEADERLGTIRTALVRLLANEPRELVWGIRGGAIVIAKGVLSPVRRR